VRCAGLHTGPLAQPHEHALQAVHRERCAALPALAVIARPERRSPLRPWPVAEHPHDSRPCLGADAHLALLAALTHDHAQARAHVDVTHMQAGEFRCSQACIQQGEHERIVARSKCRVAVAMVQQRAHVIG